MVAGPAGGQSREQRAGTHETQLLLWRKDSRAEPSAERKYPAAYEGHYFSVRLGLGLLGWVGAPESTC